jgi:hypothetical protein
MHRPRGKEFPPDDFNDPFERFPIRIDHRSPQLLRQQPCANIPLEWVVMRCAAQNHVVSGGLERCIVVPAVTEVCRPQSNTFMQTRSAFQPNRTALAPARTPKPSGRRLHKKAAQLSSSKKRLLEFDERPRLAISVRRRDRANPIAQILHLGALSQRDKSPLHQPVMLSIVVDETEPRMS